MNASRADAEDCAHDTLLTSMEALKDGQLRDSDRVISYILSIARNNYLKLRRKHKPEYLEELSPDYEQRQEPLQLQFLLDEEQERLLESCLNQLEKKYRLFMQHWLCYPNAHAENVAKKFGISKNSVWTRKHRLIKRLNDCYRKKSKF
jgi:RNA polymerase sigma factor (sigma-70 family)